MPSLNKKIRSKIKVPTIYGASDKKVTRFFIFNRAWIANERIVGLTALLVFGLGIIGYATFALTLNAPAGYIDSPANNATVSGTNAAITGWAVAATPIDHVDIVVNGVPARASYGTGGPRPDVCAQYPQSPNCANAQVGWQYYFNSTAMSNGSYSLYAAIYGSGGGVTYTPTQTFNISNSVPFGYIDTPAPGATVGNNATGSTFTNVGGWALDNETGISQVTMSIDGIATAYYPIYGAYRPDVCNAYPGRPNCPNPGFNYNLDTSNIPNGTHTMHITMYDSDGIQRSATMDRTFTISNNTPPPVLGGPGTGTGGGGGGGTTTGGGGLPTGYGIDPDGYMDDPKPAPNPPNPYSGTMTFDGWAIDAQTVITKVNVYIDGIYIGVSAHYGQGNPRPDVCANHAGWINCPGGNVGWQIAYNTAQLSNGTHKAFARIYDGEYPQHSHDTQTVSFTVSNATSPPPNGTGLPPVNPPGSPPPPPVGTPTNLKPDVYIDNINDPGTSDTTVSGWAIDNITKSESAISTVTVKIVSPGGSAALVGNADYGGEGNVQNYRPDVCSYYQGRPGCPFVGYNMLFDTSYLPVGSYTLQVTATDATGQTQTASRSFQVKEDGCSPGALACAAVDSTGRSKNDRNANNVRQFHAIYAVPSDLKNGALANDRHLDTNGSIGANINGLNNYMKSQKNGKDFRVDTYAGKVDVTFVRVAHAASYFNQFVENASTGSPFVSALVNDIQNANSKLFVSNKKYVIYFEGGNRDGCAVTSSKYSVLSLRGNQSGVACSSLLSVSTGSNKALLTQKLVAHEMIHNLGAVNDINGKNTCVHHIKGSGHVTDANDLMVGPAPVQLDAQLDVGSDSYWGSKVDTSGCLRVDTDPSTTPYLY